MRFDPVIATSIRCSTQSPARTGGRTDPRQLLGRRCGRRHFLHSELRVFQPLLATNSRAASDHCPLHAVAEFGSGCSCPKSSPRRGFCQSESKNPGARYSCGDVVRSGCSLRRSTPKFARCCNSTAGVRSIPPVIGARRVGQPMCASQQIRMLDFRLGSFRGNVCLWPKADITIALTNVCFRG